MTIQYSCGWLTTDGVSAPSFRNRPFSFGVVFLFPKLTTRHRTEPLERTPLQQHFQINRGRLSAMCSNPSSCHFHLGSERVHLPMIVRSQTSLPTNTFRLGFSVLRCFPTERAHVSGAGRGLLVFVLEEGEVSSCELCGFRRRASAPFLFLFGMQRMLVLGGVSELAPQSPARVHQLPFVECPGCTSSPPCRASGIDWG